jgi:inositol phosphorylceramide mannosyltransferase catalytic subunit
VLLSICMLVADPPHRVEAALAPVRHLADEIVIAADGRVDPADLAGYHGLCDRLYRIDFVNYERHLAWLHAQCRGDWVMPVEGDEVISEALADRLPSLLGRRDVRQVWTARRWVHGDAGHVLDEAPWSADHTVRLVRNDGGLSFSGVQHAHARFERPCEYLEEPVYHLELMQSDLEARRAKAIRYEVSVPHRRAIGGGRLNEAMYLPELRPSVRTRAIPAADAAAVARALAPAPAAPERAPLDPLPPVVALAEVDRHWALRPLEERDYAARIEPAEDPVFAPGELRPVFARVVNEGGARWPWSLDHRPAIRMSYRWLHPDGSVAVPEGRRTPFPRAVAPGDTVVVPVEVIAPDAPGEYVLELDIVHEHVRWFGCDRRVRATVRVTPGVPEEGPRLVPTPPSPAWRRTSTLIPRVFHRVWLGDAAMPADHVRYGETFAEHHPGWEMRLWTDEDLPSLGIGAREIERSRTLVELSDLVRHAILARHGGVYVDTDVECLRPFDPLLLGVRAFAGLEMPGRLGTAVLGAVPGHRLFERAAAESRSTVGLGVHSIDAVGPYFLSLLAEQEPSGLAIFARETFYPYLWDERERAAGPFPDSYAVHHWATGAFEVHTIPA